MIADDSLEKMPLNAKKVEIKKISIDYGYDVSC